MKADVVQKLLGAIVTDPEALGALACVHDPKISRRVSQKLSQKLSQKVFEALPVMLLVTFGFVALSVFAEPFNEFIRWNWYLYWSSCISFLVLFTMSVFCPKARYAKPCKFITLVGLTISMCFMLAYVASYHSLIQILWAVGGTFVICASVCLFAVVFPCDVTGWEQCLRVVKTLLVVSCLLSILWCELESFPQYRIIRKGAGSLFLLLFSLYLVKDMQQIVGGSRYQLPTKEYILGVVMLYVDIAFILKTLLHIVR